MNHDLLFSAFLAIGIHIGLFCLPACSNAMLAEPLSSEPIAVYLVKPPEKEVPKEIVKEEEPVPKEEPPPPVMKDEAVIQVEPEIPEPVAEESPEIIEELSDITQPVMEDREDAVAVQEAHPITTVNRKPKYPKIAIRNNWEGTVVLRVYVITNGRCDDVEIVRSSGHRVLDKAAVKAVLQWQFKPASKNFMSLATWVEVPVTFLLTDR